MDKRTEILFAKALESVQRRSPKRDRISRVAKNRVHGMTLDAFDLFDEVEETEHQKEESRERDLYSRKLESLKRGDIISVGGKKWEVFANRGADVLVYKFGSKQRKAYKLDPISIRPPIMGVYLIGGSGQIISPEEPVAQGPW